MLYIAFVCRFFCSHTIKIIFPKKKNILFLNDNYNFNFHISKRTGQKSHNLVTHIVLCCLLLIIALPALY